MDSCEPLYLPLGSAFLLDILPLMNCHYFSFQSSQRKLAIARTRPLTLQLSCILRVQKAAAASGAPSPHFFCLFASFPSLISDRTHLLACDRRPLLSLGRGPGPPFAARRRAGVRVRRAANEREKLGEPQSWTFWNRTRGPPQLCYITHRKTR